MKAARYRQQLDDVLEPHVYEMPLAVRRWFYFSTMDDHVISLAKCGTGWMDWAQGTNRLATKIPGLHDHKFFPLGSVEVTCVPHRATYRLTTIKKLCLLLLQTLHLELWFAMQPAPWCATDKTDINGRLLASVFPCETGIKGHPINTYKYKHFTVCKKM